MINGKQQPQAGMAGPHMPAALTFKLKCALDTSISMATLLQCTYLGRRGGEGIRGGGAGEQLQAQMTPGMLAVRWFEQPNFNSL